MPPHETLSILARAPVTRGLDPDDLQHLLRHAAVETIFPKKIILAEGQHSEALYIVLSGRCKAILLALDRRDHPNRVRDIHLNTLSPGDCFGEYSLIDSEPASASVVAAEPVELLKITKADFEAAIAANDRLAKTIYRNLLHILVRRLRRHNQELDLNLDVLDERTSLLDGVGAVGIVGRVDASEDAV